MQRHCFDGDGAWLAVDAHGHVAVLTTAGVAPIPTIVLDSYGHSPEDSVDEMPVVGGYDRMPYDGDLSSWTGFAARGFFAYDWQDVHRTSGFSRSYELMARPHVPITASRLGPELFRLARLVTLETVAFDQTLALPIERLLPCKPGDKPLRRSVMRQLNGAEFESFVTEKPVAAIHFDAEWDVSGRPPVTRSMLEAERVFGDRVNFAEVDIDRDAELAKSISLLNVPAVAYFRDGVLVATLIGSDQNVAARVERVLRGEPIGYQDGTSVTSPPRAAVESPSARRRRPRMLWLRTALFTLLVPGTVLVLVPAALLAAGVGPDIHLGPARWAGVVPLALGAGVILKCFVDFVRRGRGTPAPYDPPRELVIAGLYRYVRNPQYVGVVLVAVGEALLFEAAILLGYAAVLAVGYHLFVRYYEEPTLARLFGESYARYRRAVPRWLPRTSATPIPGVTTEPRPVAPPSGVREESPR